MKQQFVRGFIEGLRMGFSSALRRFRKGVGQHVGVEPPLIEDVVHPCDYEDMADSAYKKRIAALAGATYPSPDDGVPTAFREDPALIHIIAAGAAAGALDAAGAKAITDVMVYGQHSLYDPLLEDIEHIRSHRWYDTLLDGNNVSPLCRAILSTAPHDGDSLMKLLIAKNKTFSLAVNALTMAKKGLPTPVQSTHTHGVTHEA